MVARNTILSVLFLLALSLHNRSVLAQHNREIGFRRFSVDQGLSQSAVNCITQDQEGFLWFGTQDGLNKYDGYTFTNFRNAPADSTSLSDNYVTALLADSRGNLWIGTYAGGLNRLNTRRGNIQRFPLRADSLASRGSNPVMAIAEDTSGSIWAATWVGGLHRLDPATHVWTHCRHEEGYDSSASVNRATALALDSQKRLWAGTWDGLHRYDPSTDLLQRVAFGSAVSAEERKIMSVYPDTDGTVWYGTFAAGLLHFNPHSSTLERYTTSGPDGKRLSAMSVRSITKDAGGRLWVATWEGGINILDPRTGDIQSLSAGPPPALSVNYVFSLFRDRSDGIWVGTDGGGVNHYDPARFKFLHIQHESGNQGGLSNPMVRALCRDRAGYVWIGSEAMLDRLDTRTGRVTPWRQSGLSRKAPGLKIILALLEDSDGNLWVGTDGGGLYRLDPSRTTWRAIPIPRSKNEIVGPDHVIALMEATDGSLWIGTLGGGLIRMNRRTLEHTRYRRTSRTAASQLSGNYIYSLLEDRAGNIWIGTWGAGITVLDPRTGTFKIYQHDEAHPHSLSQNSVLAFHQDARGTMWIATLGGGLDAFESLTESFSHITEADGLPNNVINGILEDEAGRLWLSTNRGVCCFNPVSRTFRTHDIGDGLQSMEFNQGAFCKGHDDAMYFGGINGLNVFFPGNLPVDSIPPPVAITRCSVFDRPILLPGEPQGLELSHDQNFVSFEFTAFDFTAPEKNSYSYKMEGVDRDWVSCGSRRYASYTNVPPGSYVFRVRGSNSDGVWNEAGASLALHIAPPFWGTGWFRVLALALILGSMYGIYRRRIRQLEKLRQMDSDFSRKLNESQEITRKRIAGELHDGLGQELLTVKNSLARIAGVHTPAVQTQLADVETAVHRAIEEVRQISADLHPHMLDRLGLTRTIESMVHRMADAACLKITPAIDAIDGLLSPPGEINFYRIVQEALTNVVKHSRASQCTVRIQHMPAEIHLVVQDDGRGFEPDRAVTADAGGLGLVNMAERVRLLRGDMEIRSAPGSGTALIFHFPLSPQRPPSPLSDNQR